MSDLGVCLGTLIWNQWFWLIDDEPGIVYSASIADKMPDNDERYTVWLEFQATEPRRVPTAADLYSDIEPLNPHVAWRVPEWGRQPGQIDGLPQADGTAWTGPAKVDPVEKLKQFLDANPDVKEYLME